MASQSCQGRTGEETAAQRELASSRGFVGLVHLRTGQGTCVRSLEPKSMLDNCMCSWSHTLRKQVEPSVELPESGMTDVSTRQSNNLVTHRVVSEFSEGHCSGVEESV